MLKNYLKIALRNFWKEKEYSLINVLGLTIGISASMFILLYIQDELSYDAFHEKGDRIYRITESFKNGEGYTQTASSPYLIAPLLAEQSAAVEDYTRIAWGPDRYILKFGDQKFEETGFNFVDANFFETFSIPLIQGQAEEVLQRPGSIVLSEDKAREYFGTADPLGKELTVVEGFNGIELKAEVTGVMKNMPHNMHFHYDMLMPMATAEDSIMNGMQQSWGWTSQYSYIVLGKGQDVEQVKPLLSQIQKENSPEWFQEWAYFGLQPMQDIHLHSSLKDEIQANGDIKYIYIFGVVALLILLIACVNYMNLATSRAMNRAKEVGLRKVIGARRQQLLFQFLSESMTISFIAFLLAIVMIPLLMPYFNAITGKQIAFSWLDKPQMFITGMGIALLVGLLAGIYPALFLAGFQPVKVLQGVMSKHGSQSLALRKGLVVGQFTVSIVLIISMFVIFNQWQYLRSKKLGIETEQMLLIPFQSQQRVDTYHAFKNELKQHPAIVNVTATNKDPLSVFSNYRNFNLEGQDESYTIPYIAVDRDFFDTYGTEIVEGRGFVDYQSDSASTIILNEAAVSLLGLENPVGAKVQFSENYQPTIVGVVKDFHFESLYSEIRPMYFYHTAESFGTMCVRVRPGQVDKALTHLEDRWKAFSYEESFQYSFLDEAINRQYEAEARVMSVFTTAAGLAIFIACLGIIGLAAFSATQRKKEISIRKVLGAQVSQILALLTKEFLYLILAAIIIATPIAYFLMSKWLQDFAYRVPIHWWVFLLAGGIALLIAFVTVSLQSLKAATSNPVNALRND